MDWAAWKKVLELAAANPELIGALAYILGAVCTISGGLVWVTWLVRGAIAKGRAEALEERLKLAGEKIADAEEKIALARHDPSGRSLNELLESAARSTSGAAVIIGNPPFGPSRPPKT